MNPGRGVYRNLLGPTYYWVAIEPRRMSIRKYRLRRKYNEVVYNSIKKISFYDLPLGDCVILGNWLTRMKKEDMLGIIELLRRRYPFVIVRIKYSAFSRDEREQFFREASLSYEGQREIFYLYE